MLPIHTVLEPLKAALAAGNVAVLAAPPGAGKTTVVPLALLAACSSVPSDCIHASRSTSRARFT